MKLHQRYLAAVAGVVLAIGAGNALGANPPGTGQPSQTCLSTATGPNEPGHAAAAQGSAFNESLPGMAGTVYAGSGVSATTAGSTNAVSQYDVACFQVSQ